MPRPSTGPRLVPLKKRGWTRTIFYIRWYENGAKKEHPTPFTTSDPGKAQEYFQDWLNERRRAARTGPGDPDQILVTDVLDDYAKEHGSEVASPESLVYAIEPLRIFFRDDTIATLTPERSKEYWEWRREHSVRALNKERTEVEVIPGGVGDGTIRRELGGTLRPAITHAVQNKRLVQGAYHIELPPEQPGREYWITRSEAARLLWETRRDPRARLHLPLYALIALYTGQRRGAILDLTWPQIDLILGRINFNPPGRVQTKKRRPVIPIPRSLKAALRRAQKRATSPYVIAYQGAKVGDCKTGFNSAAARAGIKDCTSHTLRHTAGTWMAQKGVPLRQIGGWLGHSETRTTELYAHHHPDFMKEALAAFDG